MDFTILQILSLLDPAYNLQQRFMAHHHFITNIPQNTPVKKNSKSVNIWRRYGQMFAAYIFGLPLNSILSNVFHRH